MLASIFEFIVALIKAVPIFDRWFTRTPTEQIEDDKERERKRTEEERKTGRPKW